MSPDKRHGESDMVKRLKEWIKNVSDGNIAVTWLLPIIHITSSCLQQFPITELSIISQSNSLKYA